MRFQYTTITIKDIDAGKTKKDNYNKSFLIMHSFLDRYIEKQ